jgi:outer membrane receptor protein involved in Fe transport
LNPALTLTPPIPGQQPFGKGTSGNADLQPVRSDNYDLSLEWYIDRSNSITLTAFRRDVTGFHPVGHQQFPDRLSGRRQWHLSGDAA